MDLLSRRSFKVVYSRGFNSSVAISRSQVPNPIVPHKLGIYTRTTMVMY